MMKAVVCDRFGPPDVLRIADVDRPVPKDDEVLIRVHATTVTRTDCGIRCGKPLAGRLFYGLRRPRWPILGGELAGEVTAIGPAVTEFAPGDLVFGVSPWRYGTHAGYVCVPQSAPLAHKPDGMPLGDAAAVCDGVLLALLGLRPVKPSKGRSILVYGASGSIGTAAVQLSAYFHADVTAVCDTRNVTLLGELGAGEVIDYTKDDFTENGRTYDVIFDAVGKHSYQRCRRSLTPGGRYVATDGFRNLVLSLTTRRVLFPIPPRFRKEDVLFLKQLIEAGRYRAVVDRRYPLADVVEATRYVETGQKTGNVVLTTL